MRACTKCGEAKPPDGFYKGNHRDGRTYYCKSCINENHRILRQDPEFRKRSNERRRQWSLDNPEREKRTVRNAVLRAKYGIGVVEYEAMLAEQGGRCAICRTDRAYRVDDRPFHVDHCHRTGVVRGLLCQRCNTSIGRMNDDPEILRAAIEYLERPLCVS